MSASAKPLALLSVTDKTGIVEFARGLVKLGYELLSTGGTAKLLQESDVPCIEAAAYTGSPEILDGRVKTLHPKIHGGILHDRQKPSHLAQIEEFGIRPIDFVVVNLYAFEKEALGRQLPLAKAIEYIDIGGPCMLRAASKNYQGCTPVIDPSDYNEILRQLSEGPLTLVLRQKLAGKVFRHISQYDGMIAASFEASVATEGEDFAFPSQINLKEVQSLRYGENPHQKAKFYASQLSIPGGLQDAQVLQGKELSFNNLLDVDAAAQIVADFPEYTAVAVIKHTNPCGVAIDTPVTELATVYQKALAADPKSAFGGIVALNKTVDGATAALLAETFLECIVGPGFDASAREILGKKKNLRLLELPYLAAAQNARLFDVRSIVGGFLVQEKDQLRTERSQWQQVSERAPNEQQSIDLVFAQRVCKHVKSNAIVYAKNGVTLAIGAGQMSRIDSAHFAVAKAKEFGQSLVGAVMASDAFFPFRDSVDAAAAEGIAAIVQPGGSVRDPESIAAANEHGLAMVFTQIRHFKH